MASPQQTNSQTDLGTLDGKEEAALRIKTAVVKLVKLHYHTQPRTCRHCRSIQMFLV